MIIGTSAMSDLARTRRWRWSALLPFPLIAWLVYTARNHMQRGFQRGGRAWANMTSVLADTIPGIRVVKAFAQEKREDRTLPPGERSDRGRQRPGKHRLDVLLADGRAAEPGGLVDRLGRAGLI